MMRLLPVRFAWPLIVPTVWCLTVLAMMDPQGIARRPDFPSTLGTILNDPVDLTALALRGANQANGRLPGRMTEPAWNDPEILADQLSLPQPPLSERYYLEYPLPTAFLFRLPYTTPPDLPPVVADGFQYGVSQWVPLNEEERKTWLSLRTAVRTYIVSFLLLAMTLFVVLGIGYRPGEPWNPWVAVMALPGCCFFTLHRFDIAPTLALALAFAALGRKRIALAGVCLGVGVIIKVFPVILAPVIVRYLGIRKGFLFCLAFGAVIALGFGIAGLLTDATSVINTIRVQTNRTLETGWTLYGLLLPESLGKDSNFRFGILSAIILACSLTVPRDLDSVLRRCGIILVAFVVLAVFWSPQWFLWFLPILIPLARRRRWYGVAAIVIDLAIYFSFPILFWVIAENCSKDTSKALVTAMAVVRGLMWFGLAGMFAGLRTSNRQDRLREFLESLPAIVIDEGNRRGIPKGLTWRNCESAGKPIQKGDWAFVPFNIGFEPIPGSDMEGIAAASMPRPIVAVLREIKGNWRLDRPPIFNVAGEEVARQITG